MQLRGNELQDSREELLPTTSHNHPEIPAAGHHPGIHTGHSG